MEMTFIHELERILQVNAPREVKADFGYPPSASDIFKSDGFDVLLNNKRFHFKPVANPDLEEALKTYHGILAESVQPKLAYEFRLGSQSSFYWMKRSAELGIASAQNDLGECYLMGRGVSKDHIEAIKWYTKSAQQGNAKAQYNLGYCYKYGYGVPLDYINAAKWYRKAAEQGHNRAQRQLGDCYYYGDGVSRDYVIAVDWYLKAAKQGNTHAEYMLEKLGYSI